jgi:prephenate dehydrogenase
MERISIVGLGLVGGSVGIALGSSGSEIHVVGFDTEPATATAARDRGAVDEVADSLSSAVRGARLVVVAVPVDGIPDVLEAISEGDSAGAVVTDVGSAKRGVVTAGEKYLGEHFVGGHPMAGSERHGIEAARGDLFEDAWWILTPTPSTSSAAYQSVAELAARVGAKPVAVDPDVHDTLVARLSHLPQLTASALVEVAVRSGDREALLGLAAAGFRDVTRIAASNPDLWVAIIRSNRAAVLEALAGLSERLDAVGEMIRDEEWGSLRGWLDRSRSARVQLFAKPDYGGEPVGISLIVPDRPGVLAEVTTAAGELGANLEDLRIVHSTEGGRGRLELIVSGKEPAELLIGSLIKLGYHPERVELEL